MGFKPCKLYNSNPLSGGKKNETIIENRYIDNEIYYAFQHTHKEWGAEIYFKDERNNKMRLFYENQNEDGRMLLSQLDYMVMDEKLVDKVYCYMYDLDLEEEIFYIFEYFYEDEIIKKIIRSDYFNIFSEIIFNENNKFNLKKI